MQVTMEAKVGLCFALVLAFLFGMAAYATKYQVDSCEAMKCNTPLRARLIRSTHYTNECVCVEVPE